jgi:polysaccharide export outer membrane protein
MNQCAIIHAKEQVIKFLYKSPMFKHKTSTLSKVLYFFALLTISSCAPSRNLVYFSDLKNTADYTEDIKNKIEPKIQSDDLLSISVSSLNPESNLLFNSGVMQTAGSGGGTGASTKVNEGYLAI